MRETFGTLEEAAAWVLGEWDRLGISVAHVELTEDGWIGGVAADPYLGEDARWTYEHGVRSEDGEVQFSRLMESCETWGGGAHYLREMGIDATLYAVGDSLDVGLALPTDDGAEGEDDDIAGWCFVLREYVTI